MENDSPPIQSNNNNNSTKIITTVIVGLLLLASAAVGGYAYGKWVKDKELQTTSQNLTTEITQLKAKVESATLSPAKTTTETTCNADELSLSVGQGSASAGTLAYNLIFTNIGNRTCDLFGYPGVSLVNQNGNMVGQPAERVANSPETKQSLAPGAKVVAPIMIGDAGNFPAGQCQDGASKLRVYPPNDTGYLSVASPITSWCPDFKVMPVAAN